jgi:nucleoside 2-deoxyribosyltransferase
VDNNQCEELSYLAPYVPSDELNELNSNWEELCNNFNFDEFFPAEMPVQMPQQPRQAFKGQPSMVDQLNVMENQVQSLR